jgi:hypothetical protein
VPLWERPEVQEMLFTLMIEADLKRPNTGLRPGQNSRGLVLVEGQNCPEQCRASTGCFWQLGLAHFGGLIWPTPWDVKV